MIKSEALTINGRNLIRYWSSNGMMITRDGQLFVEAVDPANKFYKYQETNIPIEVVGDES